MTSKTQQSSSQSSTTPNNLSALQSIYNTVQGAASTPYQAYNGELTAGINGQQTTGINNINANANYANPYVQSAGNLVQNAAQPLTQSQIQNYLNPYTQNVVDATQAQFNKSNAEQQNSVKGNATIAGALGGDRQAVAQAQLAGQQQTAEAPVIAGLYNQGYQGALNTAYQQYQQNPLAAGSSLANIGVAGQNAALQGANAQIGAGTLQQTTQQNQDTAAYQQYLQKQGYPFQTAQFLAQYGLPAATAQGSTTSGTQTTPGPNTAAQIAGLGISAAGLFLKDGGSVNGYAAGGSPFNFIEDAKGYVPISQSVPSAQLPSSQIQFAKPAADQQNPFASSISGLNKMQGTFAGEQYGGGNVFTDASGGSSDSPLEGLSASDYGAGFKVGGLVEAIHHIRHSIKRARGGAVGTSPFAAYADGGDISMADRFAPVQEAIASGDFDPQGINSTEFSGSPMMTASNDGKIPVPVSRPADASPAPMQVALPKQISNPDDVPEEEPSQAMAFDRNPMSISPPAAPAAPAQGQFGHSLFGANLSDKTRQSLVAAGLGMLASKSPFFGTALGEGGLKGIGAYSDLTKQEQEAANTAATKAQNQQRIDMEAKRLSQSAEQFAKTNSQAERRLKLSEDKTPEGYRATKDGNYEPIPGGPADPEMLRKVAEAKRTPGAVIDDDTANFVADQVLAGDNRALIGFGRGAQGAENLLKVRALVAQKARDQGKDPTDILNNVAIQSGNTAAQRTFGTQTAKMAVNATEAQGAIELGRTASAAVPRTNWVPVNKAIQAYQAGTSDPALAKFGAANLAIINTYSRAISPTGVPTVNDKQHAEHLLSTATSQEAYNAVLDQMNEEIKIAHAAPQKAKQEIEDIRKGKKSEAAPTPAPPASKPASVVQNGHTYTLQPDGSYK